MADIRDMRIKATEAAKNMRGIAAAAAQQRMSITQVLEDNDPTHNLSDVERATGLDAFGRVLRELGIRTRSIPEMGIMADEATVFGRDENTAVAFGEWLERRIREVSNPTPQQQRAIYGSADQPQGSVVFPLNFDPTPHGIQIAPAVPIAEVVAQTTPIKGSSIESYYFTDVTTQKRLVRVPEGTDVPAVKLSGTTHTIRVRKFGRRLDASYETIRRMTIDLLALHIQRMMVQAEVDKLAAILDVIVNGDMSNTGNGATVYQLSTLDSAATPGNGFSLTLKAYLRFKAKFRNPYTVTTILGNEDVIIGAQLLNTGNAFIPLAYMTASGSPFGSMTPINSELADAVRIGLTDDAPSNKLVAIDKRFGVNRIVEIGGDITESVRWATKQVESLVMTMEENYAIIDANAIKILDLAS